jgi:hypothetical protein
MAKIIKTANRCKKMLTKISWREIVQIYSHSVLILIYICGVNLLKFFKFHIDMRVQKIMKQFWMLSPNRNNYFVERRESVKRKARKNGIRSISPLTLTLKLGSHKYIKINVRKLQSL